MTTRGFARAARRSPSLRRGLILAAALVMSPAAATAQPAPPTPASSPSPAQTSADSERAERLFAEARLLVDASRYAEACPKFEESQRLDPGLGTQFNLALCFERVGKLGSAWRNFRAVERLANITAKRGRADAARQKLEELRPRVAHLVLSARDADATLAVDGAMVERDTWSFYAVDAGEHTVEATAPAKTSYKTRVTVAQAGPGGRGTELVVAVPPLAAAEGRVVTVTRDTSNARRTVGFAFGGVGLVGLGAAFVTGLVLLNEKSIAEQRCTPTCRDAAASDAVTTGKTLLPINAIAWGVAALGLGVGTFLVLTSGPSKATTAARLVPLAGPEGGGAAVLGQF